MSLSCSDFLKILRRHGRRTSFWGCQPFMDQAGSSTTSTTPEKIDLVETELKTHGDVPGQSFDPSSSISSITVQFFPFFPFYSAVYFFVMVNFKIGKEHSNHFLKFWKLLLF